MDRPVLNYGDIFLRQSDVNLLKGPCWLNDQVIAFYLLYLTKDKYPGLEEVEVVEPSVAFWLICCPEEEVAPIVASRKLKQKSLIIFPINDNDNPLVAQGGSHWSTLVFRLPRGQALGGEFTLFDSMLMAQGPPTPAAATLAQKLAPHLLGGRKRCPLVVGHCPLQQNGFDCGLYVFAVAEVLVRVHAQRVERHRAMAMSQGPDEMAEPHDDNGEMEREISRLLLEVTPEHVTALRSAILATINKFTPSY
eukprot:jgi/Mesvir1/9275/Mv03136-RA.1